MSWFNPTDELSDTARKALEGLVSACSSEANAVAECLNNIASNGGEQAEDSFLAGCAEEIAGWARDFIDRINKEEGHAQSFIGSVHQPEAEKLAQWAMKENIDTGDLDELVHDAKSAEASGINNGGAESQFRYLLTKYKDADEIKAALK